MRYKRLVIAAVIATALLAACGPRGSGNIVTEVREVGEFANIEVSGGIDLRLTVDPAAPFTVSAIYDDNLLDRVVTEVEGNTLVVRSSGTLSVFGSGRVVEVSMPNLEGLTASGGSDVDGNGAAESIIVEASGGADLDLGGLVVDVMELHASGGADVTVNVTGDVSGDASGGSDVTIRGDPAARDIDVSGGADVNSD